MIMSLENFPLWPSLFGPMVYFFKTKINHSNRITTLETKIEKLDKLDELCDDIHYIKGLLDEHLRK